MPPYLSSTHLPYSHTKHNLSQHANTLPPPTTTTTMNAEKVAGAGDLLTEILRRLPSKSVGRFLCVSKRWLSILTDPKFRRLHHLTLHPRTTAIFLFRRSSHHCHHYTYLDLISLSPHHHHKLHPILDKLSDFHKDGAEILNIHSCKGLICVHTFINPSVENQSIGSNNRIYAYNPLTFESRLIPKLNTKEIMYNVLGVYMVFEPLSDYYNIVCAWERVMVNEYRDPRVRDIVMFSFYSSKTGDWSASKAVLLVKKNEIEFEQGVVWNENVHWFGWRPKLVCLDVRKKCFRTMPEPTHFQTMRFWYFGESGGKLHLVGHGDDSMLLDVLELDGYCNEWTMKHRVDLSWFLQTKWFRGGITDHQRPYPPNEHEMYCILGFDVLCFVVDYRDGSEKLVISVGDKIVLYDISGMEIEEIANINPLKSTMVKRDVSDFKWFQVHQLIKTHVSL